MIDYASLELPGGRRLIQDAEYGYWKVWPRPTVAELDTYYGHVYHAPTQAHDPVMRVAEIVKYNPGPGRVIDVGCGRGTVLAEFQRQGWDVLGIEPSQLDATAAHLRGISVISESLTDSLARQIAPADVVLMLNVLEHLPRPKDALALVHRLLLPGGLLVCLVPNDCNPLQEAAVEKLGLRPWWIVYPDHLNYFSHATLAALATGHGFEVVKSTTDFPMEMFLLWGEVYVDNPDLGRECHTRRCRLEESLHGTGLLPAFYDALVGLHIGRSAIIYARKKG